MMETDPLAAAGKEQGEIIAAYLIRRMQDGTITPIEASKSSQHTSISRLRRWFRRERLAKRYCAG